VSLPCLNVSLITYVANETYTKTSDVKYTISLHSIYKQMYKILREKITA